MKYNKYLSQLEAIYQIAPPVGLNVDPIYVSDYINHLLENGDISGSNEESFTYCINKHPNLAKKIINKKLNESGHIVNMKCLSEGIQQFLTESINEKDLL